MADLKAAAKRIRNNWSDDMDFLKNAPMSHVLAAQALEAWAWMEAREVTVKRWGDCWICVHITDLDDNCYHADTPLGAVLAAMEGERK